MIYNYLVSDTANNKVASDSLRREIEKSETITIQVVGVSYNATNLDIEFLAALSVEEQGALTALVGVHEGVPIPNVRHVTVDNKVITDKGTDFFETLISHNFTDTASWPAVDNSCHVFEPSPGQQMLIPKAEVQFSHDVTLATSNPVTEMYFDTWVYNPLVDLGSPIDPDDETFVPGVSPGNPLRFLYERKTFAGLKDVFDLGNDHYTMTATVDGIPGVTTVRFDYDQLLVLKSSQGAQIRVCLKGNVAMGGNFCTVSIVERQEPEV